MNASVTPPSNRREAGEPNPHRLIRISEVLEMIPISRTSWWLGVKEGRFPQARMMGSVPCWRFVDIKKLMDNGEQTPAPATHAVARGGRRAAARSRV